MKMTIYDLRTSDEQAGFIQACNRSLHEIRNNPYLASHGNVCSPQWWTHLDEGKLAIKVRRGPVTHVGLTRDEFTDEPCDIIRFDADRRDHEYDREGFWMNPHIHVGDIVTVTTTKAVVETPTGEKTWFIDLTVEIENANHELQAANQGTP